jgi:hypothetical protein
MKRRDPQVAPQSLYHHQRRCQRRTTEPEVHVVPVNYIGPSYPSTCVVITVAPIQGRPSYYTIRADGRLLGRSRTPLLDGTRALLAAGYPPNTILVMKHAASDDVALTSIIGAAARLTVNDNRLGAPQFRRWRAAGGDVPAPPVRHTRLPSAGHRVDATSLLDAPPSPRAAPRSGVASMRILSADERLAEARGVKALIVGPVDVGNAVRKRKPLPGGFSRQSRRGAHHEH